MDEHTLNDLLECSVCLDRLDTSSKVLPCQHTFCRKCLEVIIFSHSELRCPECRVLVDTKIGDLPPNVLLMRILEGMKNASATYANNRQQTALNSSATENPCKRIDLQPNGDNQTLVSTEAITNNSSLSINANENVATTAAVANCLASREPLSRRTTQSNQENSPRVDQQQPQQIAKRIEQSNVIRPTNLVRQPLQNNSSNKQMPQNIASLPTPHAKALYDFESKESGDLSFKKGDMIALLRRIDVNWFVGECNGREGVFPVNYVQVLVPLPQPQCKALYDFKMGPNEEEGCLTFKKGAIINVLRRVDQNWAEGRIGDTIGIFPIQFVEMNSLAKYVIDASSKYTFSGRRIVPATPNEQNNKHNGFSSDTSSTTMTTTSPNSSTTSNTSSNSSTAPNSPLTHSQPTVHNASHTSAANDNRFSLNSSGAGNTNSVASNGMSKNRHSKEIVMQSNAKTKPNAQKHSSSKSAQNDSTHNNQATKSSSSKTSSNGSSHRLRQSSPSASSVPSNAFVALYPYKPQKSDELELKKGSVYYVKERCQDGWFRGTNRSQKSGVFPGNYVATLRNNGSRNDGSGSGQPTSTGAISNNQKRSHGNNSNSNQTNAVPKLPPRSSGSTSSVWSKPIGQHVEALFGRSQSSLIKRITNIKRSKSPVANQSAPSYSMDNPVFEDNTIGCVESANLPTTTNTKRNTIHLSHPVHVRSGSCPSQLLQSLPVEININSVPNTSGGIITKADMFGSQRVKGHRERPTLQALRQNMEAASGRSKNGESSSSYHRKSQSLDAATIAEQIANCSTVEANSQTKRKSHTHNEKFKCIVSYPPNSEFELELMVGDIVFVHKKRENGWYKGTHARTGKIGLFPSSFVEPDI